MKTKIFLTGIFLMLFASILFSATIEGSVSDNASGNSISDAEVKLYKMGIIIRTVKTDNIGMFKFDNLDEGPYNVRVNVKGYSEFFEKNRILKVRMFIENKEKEEGNARETEA